MLVLWVAFHGSGFFSCVSGNGVAGFNCSKKGYYTFEDEYLFLFGFRTNLDGRSESHTEIFRRGTSSSDSFLAAL